MIQALYPVMCPLTLSAAVTVIYKSFFKYRGNVVINIMMNDPVAKVCSKNLSFNRFVDNKANTWLRIIFSFDNILTKFKKIMLKMFLKFECINSIALVTTRSIVSNEQTFQKLFPVLLIK